MKILRISGITMITALLLSAGAVQCQTIDLNHYELLRSSGNIPEAIVKVLSLDNWDKIGKETAADEKKTAQQKKSFLMGNDWETFQQLRNGNILIGDPLSAYIIKVAAELLKDDPQLFSELNFYVAKRPEINAFSNNNGFVFVNVGMIANLETEAELAFILAHEIAHFVKKHPLESHLENIKLFKGRNAYGFQSLDQKIDQLGRRSREIEFEADSLGIALFLASPYNPGAIESALKRLNYSYIPYPDEPFDTRFFDENDFVIPACFYLDSCAKKSPIKDTYDENYAHPNIFKRIQKVQKILSLDPARTGKDFPVSESEFMAAREIARFELIHLNVRDEAYGDAIYDAYALLKKYPGNRYLELCIAESLYGLAKYKNEDKYFYVAEPYEKAEGPSQQIHFFLKQMNRKQLNVLAVKYIQRLRKKYPSVVFLDKLETDLIEEMFVKNNIDPDIFKDAGKFASPEKPDNMLTKREQQKLAEHFYAKAFADAAKNDTAFSRKCAGAMAKKEIESNKPRLSEKEKYESEKKKTENARLKGLHISFDNLIVMDPYYEISREFVMEEYQQYDKNKKELDQKTLESAQRLGLKPVLLSSRDVYTENNIEKYNELCVYREIQQEIMTHNIDSFYPVGATYFSEEKTGKHNILCFIGIFSGDPTDQYYISFIDLNTGEVIYWNEKKVVKGNFDKMQKYLTEDFQVLTR